MGTDQELSHLRQELIDGGRSRFKAIYRNKAEVNSERYSDSLRLLLRDRVKPKPKPKPAPRHVQPRAQPVLPSFTSMITHQLGVPVVAFTPSGPAMFLQQRAEPDISQFQVKRARKETPSAHAPDSELPLQARVTFGPFHVVPTTMFTALQQSGNIQRTATNPPVPPAPNPSN